VARYVFADPTFSRVRGASWRDPISLSICINRRAANETPGRDQAFISAFKRRENAPSARISSVMQGSVLNYYNECVLPRARESSFAVERE
jgi:hypothetical protein